MVHHEMSHYLISEYLTFVKCKILWGGRFFYNFAMKKPRFYDFKALGIIQLNDPGLQTSEQISEFSKVRIKDLYKSIPLSPLIMNFVYKKESDFNVSLLIILSECF